MKEQKLNRQICFASNVMSDLFVCLCLYHINTGSFWEIVLEISQPKVLEQPYKVTYVRQAIF